MINAEITFYNVGLSDKNLPYNRTALVSILAAGVITNGGQTYKLRLTDLAFGTPFNIDEATYYIVASATYIEIYTKDENNQNEQYRYCFINNFLRLANGNWAVSYTIDDWTSFYIGGQNGTSSPYSIHIDGFTERANVPLIKRYPSNTFFIDSSKYPLTGKRENDDDAFTKFFELKGLSDFSLPDGYKSVVYFISTPKYDGTLSGKTGQGTVVDKNNLDLTNRSFERLNSNIYLMIYDADGWNVPIYGSQGAEDQLVLPGHSYKYTDPDDSTIDKMIIFNEWAPGINGTDVASGQIGFRWANGRINILAYQDALAKTYLADIFHGDRYYKGVRVWNFRPILAKSIDNSEMSNALFNQCYFDKATTYDNYLDKSLYQVIDEFRTVKLKFNNAEIKIPSEFFLNTSSAISELSGDGETTILKCHIKPFGTNDSFDTDTKNNLNNNHNTSLAQNDDFINRTILTDYHAYKNAKITGAAGLAATSLASIVALIASVATYNVPGVIGSLSGGATGIINGVQKLQGLSPVIQNASNGDYSTSQIVKNGSRNFIIEFIEPNPKNRKAVLRYFEENGALVSMPFDDYMNNCQMEAFNAIKMSNVDVSGAPQQICRRLEEALLSGITLWTATDVGNKKVINYPLETGA